MNNYSFALDQDCLSHHGILGMKWGITLGPPYPLTGSAKKEAIKRRNKMGRKICVR